MARVLLISKDMTVGGAIADRVEEAGYELMWCPGPKRPDYVCAAVRVRCPLTTGADVAVVDGWLESDEQRKGIPSWHLVSYYRGLGLPVVALIGPDNLPASLEEPWVVAISRRSDGDEVMDAIERLLAVAPHMGEEEDERWIGEHRSA